MLTMLLGLAILSALFWLGFTITGALLMAFVWLFIKLPIFLIMVCVGLLCCITIVLIPVGMRIFGFSLGFLF